MKKAALIFLAIGMLVLGIGIAVIFQKIYIPECNSCVPNCYKVCTIYSWLTDLNKPLNCLAVYNLDGCTPAYYIIPIDIFALSIVLIAVGLILNISKKQPAAQEQS